MIAYSTVKHVRDNRPRTSDLPDWKAFADYLGEEFAKQGQDKHQTLCICPAIYQDGEVRAKANVLGWNWFAADIDNKDFNLPHATIEAIEEAAQDMGIPHVIYTTSSHTPKAHRFRLMFPLSREVTADEFPAVWGAVARWLDCLDANTKDESRLFVAPRQWNADAVFIRQDRGEPLDVDAIKQAYPAPIAQPKPRTTLTSAFGNISGLKPPCPTEISLYGDFVTDDMVTEATSGLKGGRMFRFLIRVGVRAMLKGYAITADDLATIGHELAATMGRHTNDIEHDATNAHKAAVKSYAEIKARDVEKLCPLKAKMDRWKRKAA